MSDRPDDVSDSSPAGEPGSSGEHSATASARAWVVPALLFVAGLLLGGVAVAAAGLGSDDADPVATPSSSPSPSPSPSPPALADGPQDVVVRIPAPCVQVAEEADAAFAELDAFAAAVRDFDARRLQELVDEFQDVRPRVEELSERCQALASEGIVEGELVTPTPAASS